MIRIHRPPERALFDEIKLHLARTHIWAGPLRDD